MEKILVLAYPGCGKTELEKRYQGVVDFEHQDFRYIYDESIRDLPLELRKGATDLREDNPEWPENFLTNALRELNDGKIVVSPFVRTVFDAYNNDFFRRRAENVRTILVCPKIEEFDEYVERFRKRGNSNNFIARRKSEIASIVELFEQTLDCEKITLKNDQYLADALEKFGIELSKRKTLKK